MPTTDQDARALTHLARRLREETYGCKEFDEAGIWSVFRDVLIGKNLAFSMEQVLCHFTDPEANSPGAIRRPFTPPKPSEQPKGTFRPPKREEACPTCGRFRELCAGSCTRADDDPQPSPDLTTPPNIAARLSRGIGPNKPADEPEEEADE